MKCSLFPDDHSFAGSATLGTFQERNDKKGYDIILVEFSSNKLPNTMSFEEAYNL